MRSPDELSTEVYRLMLIRDERLSKTKEACADRDRIDCAIRTLLVDLNETDLQIIHGNRDTLHAAQNALHWKECRNGVDPPSEEWSYLLPTIAA